jgi:hypothetical protein
MVDISSLSTTFAMTSGLDNLSTTSKHIDVVNIESMRCTCHWNEPPTNSMYVATGMIHHISNVDK